MQSVELKISRNDWLYIILLGALFGFFIALFFYYTNKEIQTFSTIIFGTISAVAIALFSFFFITLSNNFILPKVHKRFWYLLSFLFSYLSGALGFSSSFWIFYSFDIAFVGLIKPYWIMLTNIMGFLTFLIGLVLHQFISMKYKNERIHKQILDARIKALENELNPHFLFNTLNSISELLHVDTLKAERAILELARFLRNAIKQSSLIELSREIAMVQTYVNIENIRFSDQIHLGIDMSEDCKNRLVPKFSIQLLVENAIKHGYDQKVLHVSIQADEAGIKVNNDGKLAQKIVFGTGLSNLQDRLKFLCVGSLEFEDNGRSFTIVFKKEKI
ncbi:MAG: histidine kinase [Sulfurospirillum sp.]|nr:histidine kinase [Sulfurospirillum sp.]